jgi:hypothetical protein
MGHKMSLILSLMFVMQLLLMTGDIAMMQVRQSQMLAFATTIGQRISLEGGLHTNLTTWASTFGYTLTCLNNCQPMFGDTLTYQLTQAYDPLIISNETLTIRIVRHAIIGLYY